MMGAVDELLERSPQLATLTESLTAVRATSAGRMVLVGGEVGVGKTMLLRDFCGGQGDTVRILWGACDALFTPRPLGPLFDVAEATGGELEELVARGARPHEVAVALLRELARAAADRARARGPPLGRRGDARRAAAAGAADRRGAGARDRRATATTSSTAPIRCGSCSASWPPRRGRAAQRRRRSRAAAVAQLAAPRGVDAEDLYRRTAATRSSSARCSRAGTEDVPPTVRDAVLARRRASAAGAASARGGRDRPRQRRAVAARGARRRPRSITSRMPRLGHADRRRRRRRVPARARAARDRGVAYRPIAASPCTARRCRRSSTARPARPTSRGWPTTPRRRRTRSRAARSRRRPPPRAASLGAHREAAAQYARALRFADGAPASERAELLERRAHECYLSDQLEQAVEAQRAARRAAPATSAIVRRRGRRAALARAPARIRRAHRPTARGRRRRRSNCSRSWTARARAGTRLRQRRAAAMQLGGSGRRDRVGHARARAGRAPRRRRGAGRRAHDDRRRPSSDPTGPRGPASSSRRSSWPSRCGVEDDAGRAFVNLVWLPIRRRAYELAERHLDAGLEYCDERGLDYWRLYLLGCASPVELDRGRWARGRESAALASRDPARPPGRHALGALSLGLVRARRGDPELARCSTRRSRSRDAARRAAAARRRSPPRAPRRRGSRDAPPRSAGEPPSRRSRSRSSPREPVGDRRAGLLAPAGRPSTSRRRNASAEPYRLEMTGDWRGRGRALARARLPVRGGAGAGRRRRRPAAAPCARRAAGARRGPGRGDRHPAPARARRARTARADRGRARARTPPA